jgi:hypothetical protein
VRVICHLPPGLVAQARGGFTPMLGEPDDDHERVITISGAGPSRVYELTDLSFIRSLAHAISRWRPDADPALWRLEATGPVAGTRTMDLLPVRSPDVDAIRTTLQAATEIET